MVFVKNEPMVPIQEHISRLVSKNKGSCKIIQIIAFSLVRGGGAVF